MSGEHSVLDRFWIWVAFAAASAVSWATGLHDAFVALLMVQGIDIFTGVLVALKGRTFRSAIGKAGIRRRLATWSFILAIGVMQHRTGIMQPPPDAVGSAALGAAEWAAVAMAVMEFFSIVENVSLLGVKIPSWVVAAMDKAKVVMGLEPRPPRENGK